MSIGLLMIAAVMFGVPMVVMIAIVIVTGDVPSFILSVGGWSMALGLITGGIGAALELAGGNARASGGAPLPPKSRASVAALLWHQRGRWRYHYDADATSGRRPPSRSAPDRRRCRRRTRL